MAMYYIFYFLIQIIILHQFIYSDIEISLSNIDNFIDNDTVYPTILFSSNSSIYSRYFSRDLSELPSQYANGNGSFEVFAKADLITARKKGFEIMNLIYQRYEFHNLYWRQFFLGSFNMPSRAWDIIKYKVATRVILNIGENHPYSYGEKTSFLMIFGGSSVTAGHDNFFYQSYPMVFHRRMKPIFDALGIELFVRNIAQGANQCRPADFCYEAMGGSNPDWLGWEQSYNCKSGEYMEIMARTALANKAMMFYTASGAFIPEDCDNDNDKIPWISEEWTPDKSNITKTIIPDIPFLLNLRDTLNEWYEDGNAVGRFTSTLQGKYDGTAPHGFSVWGHSSKMCRDQNNTKTFPCNAIDMKPPCINQGGAHWMSKQAAAYGIGPNKRTFHPSIGIHMLRGETMVYNYLGAVLDAINMIQQDIALNIPIKKMFTKYQKELELLQIPGPEKPVHCDVRECWTKARCWTNYLPHYNHNYRLDNIIVGNHTGWSQIMKSQGYLPKWGYLDYRPSYDTNGGNEEIHFKVEVPRDHSIVMICGYYAKDSLKHVHFYFDFHAKNIGPMYVSNILQRVAHTNINYKGDECWNLEAVPKGIHVLTVVADPMYKGHTASISHIISFE